MTMQLFDTHCHIQTDDYPLDADVVLADARKHGVAYAMVVGCALPDSQAAVTFAQSRPGVWASIGLHPHETARYVDDTHALQTFAALADQPGVVAIGECGLDYFYNHSPRDTQIKLLEWQLQLAHDHNLPVVFHVREAFADFWPILGNFPDITGVLHSFTDSSASLRTALDRGLYIGVNGIATFNKNPDLRAVQKAVPLDRLLLETDAPYLTPVPYRGTVCEPKHVADTALFMSKLRDELIDELSQATTYNAGKLFGVEV